jgi:hypothetical protein
VYLDTDYVEEGFALTFDQRSKYLEVFRDLEIYLQANSRISLNRSQFLPSVFPLIYQSLKLSGLLGDSSNIS